MTKLLGEYNHNTGENIVREMTLEEIATLEAEQSALREAKAQREAEAEATKAEKISAYQKLGLTKAEIEALLPSDAPTRPPLK